LQPNKIQQTPSLRRLNVLKKLPPGHPYWGNKGNATGGESDISAGLGADWAINDTLGVTAKF
jgi:hypothetical protein